MKRIQGSKSVICSKQELKVMSELFYGLSHNVYHDLPLFDLNPKIKKFWDVKTDYVLIRPNNKKLTQTFFDRINKTWSKMYEKHG